MYVHADISNRMRSNFRNYLQFSYSRDINLSSWVNSTRLCVYDSWFVTALLQLAHRPFFVFGKVSEFSHLAHWLQLRSKKMVPCRHVLTVLHILHDTTVSYKYRRVLVNDFVPDSFLETILFYVQFKNTCYGKIKPNNFFLILCSRKFPSVFKITIVI